MNNKLITWKHFQKLLTCQEYFVWNDFIGSDYLQQEEDNFWDLEFDENELVHNYIEVFKNGFDLIQDHFINWINIKCLNEDSKLFIIKDKDLNLAIQKTKEIMNDPNFDVILFPVFEYDGAISKPTLYNKKAQKLSNLNMNTSTKRSDYIRAFFDYEIMLKNHYHIKEYSILTIEIKEFKKGDPITFDETFFANTSKSKTKPKNKTIPGLREAALGLLQDQTILEKLMNREILSLSKNSQKPQITFSGIDYYLRRIKEAENALRKPINESDDTDWGTNKNFNEIAYDDFPNMLPLSGTLFPKKRILEHLGNDDSLNDFYNNNQTTQHFKNQKNIINYEELSQILSLLINKKVTWYDFEGFSLPFPVISYTLPYQQLIFQVSVIRTNNDQISDVNNIIIDPKSISYEDFFQIIDAIYEQDVEAYVVYNKTYENTKLREMIKIFDQEKLKKRDPIFTKKIAEYEFKVEKIIEKTVDLLDLFKLSSISGPLPPIFLWELYGFSSIKKIEKYITKNNFQLELMIEPYSNLKIQNGLMAMAKAITRYLGGIGDQEWSEISKDLVKYCENDVKAMIMVYHFAKDLLKEKNQ